MSSGVTAVTKSSILKRKHLSLVDVQSDVKEKQKEKKREREKNNNFKNILKRLKICTQSYLYEFFGCEDMYFYSS